MVGPPRALITALALFGIESINLLMVSGVNSLQILSKINSIACGLLAWGYTALTVFFIMLQRFSIGFKSGDWAGQDILFMPFASLFLWHPQTMIEVLPLLKVCTGHYLLYFPTFYAILWAVTTAYRFRSSTRLSRSHFAIRLLFSAHDFWQKHTLIFVAFRFFLFEIKLSKSFYVVIRVLFIKHIPS